MATRMRSLRGGSGERTILVVADDDKVRRAMRFVLERNGYQVMEAADGKEGLNTYRARRGEIDLIISEVLVPKLNGLQLLRAVKREDSSARLLLATGRSAVELDLLDGLAPEVPLLTKPWTIGEITRRVRSELELGSCGTNTDMPYAARANWLPSRVWAGE